MAKYIVINEPIDSECEWDTYVGGTLCHNKATKAIVDTEDILHATEGGFHAAHLCGDHIERAFSTNGKSNAMKTTVYICADSTLTYGPYGGKNKIIPAALPILQVDSEEEAISFITLAGKSAYYNPEDTDFLDIKNGYGPKSRYLYYGEEFEKNNVETVPLVMEKAKELLSKIRGWHS